jgi:hypothetical protein
MIARHAGSMTQPEGDDAWDVGEGPDDGPDDGDARRYRSLDEALKLRKIPLENHKLIRRFTSAIGIAGYFDRGVYIKAVRANGGPALNIAYGWSNGFISEAEVIEAAGPEVSRWPSGRGTAQWGVSHPVHKTSGGGGGATTPSREYGVCPTCNYALLPGGRCGHCGD